MLSHLMALEASLAPLGYPTYRIYAPDHALNTLPYLILESAAWGGAIDLPTCGETDSLHTTFRVKAVGQTPDQVMVVLRKVRELWSPARAWTRIPMAGRMLQVRYRRSENTSGASYAGVYVDRDVTLPGTNTHPGIGVETYTLDSQPGGTP
jgi:hypothetical protein